MKKTKQYMKWRSRNINCVRMDSLIPCLLIDNILCLQLLMVSFKPHWLIRIENGRVRGVEGKWWGEIEEEEEEEDGGTRQACHTWSICLLKWGMGILSIQLWVQSTFFHYLSFLII